MLMREQLFRLQQHLSNDASEPRWRLQTLLQASARLPMDQTTLRLAGQALRASGLRDTVPRRLQFAWARCHEFESHWLLGVQAARITPEWIHERVELIGTALPQAAVLVCPHHPNQRLAFARLAQERDLAIVLNIVDGTANHDTSRSPERHLAWIVAYGQQVGALYERAFRGNIFSGRTAARAAVQHLRAGGSVIVVPDLYRGTSQTASILGRALPVARGPSWIAKRAEAPLIPFVLLPFRDGRWRLWSGSRVESTNDSEELALNRAISMSPTNWMFWDGWRNAPPMQP